MNEQEALVRAANVEVHTVLAKTYDESEPQFRAENQAKVRDVLAAVRARVPGGRLLDLGCGTGFIIRLATDIFDEIHGVDITPAMLARVDTSAGNITVHNAPAQQTPFGDAEFDAVTAYSFLHHTENYRPVLQEAARVLKPGGIFYVDQEPNKAFWEAISSLPTTEQLPSVLTKAQDSVMRTDERVAHEYGIAADTFRQAEFLKSISGGIDPREFTQAAREAGFRTSEVRPEWFLGQAEVMHGQSFEQAAVIDNYLRGILPMSFPLFKYLQFILVRQ